MFFKVLFYNETSVDENVAETNTIKVYPNPAKDVINVEINSNIEISSEFNYIITDVKGMVVSEGELSIG